MITPVSLLHRYNVPVPRYTSYPTVPFWEALDNDISWKETFSHQFNRYNHNGGISLYLHLPFCEALCTYCGCNKKITTNHAVEQPYLEALLKEWSLYRQQMPEKPVIRELHLGGGTPTFFSPANLQRLLNGIFEDAVIPDHHDFSFEGHPNNTTAAHLQCLYDLGFRRVSYGVQDHDIKVQQAINRIQPLKNVAAATALARSAGYHSVNFDLIYGLPFQTLESIEKTVLQSIALKPDRIAFYSYAHVPWTSKAQRLFSEADLPSPSLKLQLYQKGKELLTHAGYSDIGMDHFALPGDGLYNAWQSGSLHRNFMGYTTQHTGLLLGLGVSAISDAGTAYTQNDKTIHDYYARLDNNQLPVVKGYFLENEDLRFKKYIKDISCNGYTQFAPEDFPLLAQYSFPELEQLAADHLILLSDTCLQVTVAGRQFVRNICKAFDLHLLRKETGNSQVFSKGI